VSPRPDGAPDGRTGWEALDRWVKDDGAAAGAEGAPDPPPTCTTCAARLEDDQTYCLDCGSPTPLAPRLTRSSRSVAILAIALAVLGIGAGALAYAMAADDEPVLGSVTRSTETAPGAPLPTETSGGFPPLPADTTGGFPSTGTTPLIPPTGTGFGTTTSGVPPVTGTNTFTTPVKPTTSRTPTTPSGSGGDWPAGTTAWTAQVSSVRDKGDAEALKTRLRAAGEDAGVLDSSDFDELEPGYYVVFSGTFDSRAQAIAHAAELKSTYPDVFARRLSG
jgi:cell division protein FtsN